MVYKKYVLISFILLFYGYSFHFWNIVRGVHQNGMEYLVQVPKIRNPSSNWFINFFGWKKSMKVYLLPVGYPMVTRGYPLHIAVWMDFDAYNVGISSHWDIFLPEKVLVNSILSSSPYFHHFWTFSAHFKVPYFFQVTWTTLNMYF